MMPASAIRSGAAPRAFVVGGPEVPLARVGLGGDAGLGAPCVGPDQEPPTDIRYRYGRRDLHRQRHRSRPGWCRIVLMPASVTSAWQTGSS
jgi:hypothetical protein